MHGLSRLGAREALQTRKRPKGYLFRGPFTASARQLIFYSRTLSLLSPPSEIPSHYLASSTIARSILLYQRLYQSLYFPSKWRAFPSQLRRRVQWSGRPPPSWSYGAAPRRRPRLVSAAARQRNQQRLWCPLPALTRAAAAGPATEGNRRSARGRLGTAPAPGHLGMHTAV